jgi:pyroglutamyl-peptidase
MTPTAPSLLYLSLYWAALVAGSARADAQAHDVNRYVLFGFGPFDGRKENGSWQSVKQFNDGAQVHSIEVPVVWTAPRRKLLQAGNDAEKVVLVGLGEGGGGYEIETIAFNERSDSADESGIHPADRRIDADGADKLESSAPSAQLAEKLSAAGFPTQISKDAGRFLCNEMLYELLRLQRENTKIAAVYFIHVPVIGREIIRHGEKAVVDHALCAEFGRALVGSLRELHPLIPSVTASAQ